MKAKQPDDEARKAKLAHPDWAKYSGFPPADIKAPADDKPKKRAKAQEVDNGDSN